MTYLHQIDPIAFTLGPLKVHWYGIMYMLGFAAAWVLGRRRVRAGRLPGVDEQAYSDLLFYSMLGVIFGARIGYVLFYDLDNYLREPLLIFKIWQGGMSFHGGLVGVLAASLWWARKHRMHYFDVVDFVAPLVPPGLGFGRLGNFINGELWGRITDVPWGMLFRGSTAPRHPSQLYQFALEGCLLFVLLWIYSRKPRPLGAVSGAFLLGYGVLRFTAEFWREPDDFLGLLSLGLSMGQWLSAPMAILGAAMLFRSYRRNTMPT